VCIKSHDAVKVLNKCLYIFTVRLTGGVSYNQGRVEVYYNGEWGTVCSNGYRWDRIGPNVVCRQLGLGASGSTLSYRYYEKGSGSIFLSNVMCSASDHTLAACGHYGVGITYSCSHSSDVGVICEGMCVLNQFSLLLTDILHR